MVLRMRRFQDSDRAALASICCLTAKFGGDATGMLSEDRLWGDVFALPYVERDPSLAFVVVDDTDQAIGSVLGTDDTVLFDDWFRETWWPPREPHGEPTGKVEAELRKYARTMGEEKHGFLPRYPAHLHIDLLPEAQGKGWGRQLMNRLCAELRDRGVPGVHLGTSHENAGAVAFYRRLGWAQLPSEDGGLVFGLQLV